MNTKTRNTEYLPHAAFHRESTLRAKKGLVTVVIEGTPSGVAEARIFGPGTAEAAMAAFHAGFMMLDLVPLTVGEAEEFREHLRDMLSIIKEALEHDETIVTELMSYRVQPGLKILED